MKLKEVPIVYKDTLLSIISRGKWKYLDTQTKKLLVQKQKEVEESNNKASDMSPNWMQIGFNRRNNYRVNEVIVPTPEGSRAKRTVELVPVWNDRPDQDLIDKLEQVKGKELNAYKRNNSQLLGGRDYIAI